MANARKCDRCGKCFDPYHMKGDMCRFKNPVFQSSERMKEMKASGFLYEGSGPDAWVDLCPTCAQAFTIFMNGREQEKKDVEKMSDEYVCGATGLPCCGCSLFCQNRIRLL